MSPNSNTNKWYTAKVIPGKQIGRILGFPTINLDNPGLLDGKKEGVYASLVKINDKIYQGILYYGPRLILKEAENILEIYLFDFEQNIYNQVISFQLKAYIRPVKNFPDSSKFKEQLVSDCSRARKILIK